MDTASLWDAVQGIDEAAKKCHSLHKADVKYLQSFFRKTVEQVDKFLMKVEKLGLLAEATIDAKLLTVSLAKCLTYVEDRSSDRVFRFIFKEALSMTTSETSYCVASRDLEEEAKAAVREGIIEPVIVPLEQAMRRGGSPLQQRANASLSVELMFAIENVDRVLRFGCSEVVGYDRIGDERRLDVLVRSMEKLAISHNSLLAKLDEMAEALDVMRVTLERGGCPLVFFMAPPADTKRTWLDRAKRLDVLNKRMDLHFVCRVFFDDLRSALSQGSHVQPSPMITSEFSFPIAVKMPRKFVTKLKPVITLSILIVNLITHAAASGIGVGGFIPNLSLSDHEAMLDLMKEGLESLDQETGNDFPVEDSTGVHGSAGCPDLRLLHGSARESMQRYLREHHATTWQEQVEKNLKIALNTKKECAFVCRRNPPHEEKWAKSG